MVSTQDKDCYCFTCDKDVHHLGIMSHRAMHRRKGEYCKIKFSGGNVVEYFFKLKMSVSRDTT